MIIPLSLAFLGGLGMVELIVLGILGILLFGKRLPDVGKNLGRTIVEFKKGLNSTSADIEKTVQEEEPATKSSTKNPYEAPAITSAKRPVKQIAGTSDEP